MIHIRYGEEKDLPELTRIFNYYVENSFAVFDVKPATLAMKRQWFNRYSPKGPYRLLVAEIDRKVVGCAYSSRYRDHFSFNATIEVSIHLDPEQRSKGIGSALYSRLFEVLKDEDLHLAVAGIALPNDASVALHKKFGFEEVGVFREYAQKNGQFISSIWLQKFLTPPVNRL